MKMGTVFWKEKTLHQMSQEEWESLCDGCGKCCLIKLEDEDTGELHNTNVACALFNPDSCRCNDYEHRFEKVDDCVDLKPDNVLEISWLPSTCAYRLLASGQDLPWWHPLVSGSAETVHEAGISMLAKVIL